ncbi:MAG: aldolase [Clostridia bacterium]|nr:aldolase [Clostridia bacterium]
MIREKIKNREKIIGTHINFADPSVGRIAGLAGYDFIWIDMEHNYISFESLLSLVIAVQSTGTDVIVRAPQDDLTATKKIIEMGVDGIIFPMVRTADEANRLLSYTLYPPHGRRGFGPMNAVGYGAFDVLDYVKTNHEKMCRFIQIEHVDAVKNLDEIMKNEFIDGYIIGANDLSGSINELCNVFGENTTALITETITKLKANGKYVGLSTGDLSEVTFKHWSDMGVDMLSAGADFDFLTAGMKKNKESLQRIMKGTI